MNRGEIRTAVKQRLAIPSIGDGLLPDSVLDSLINSSLSSVSAARDWPWLLKTMDLVFTNGQVYLPNDFIRARALVYNDNPVFWTQLEDFLNPDGVWSTYAWTIIGNLAKLTPTPTTDVTCTLYYYCAEPELQSDYSTPIMPAQHHPVLVAHTAYLASLTRQDEGRAAVYRAEYETLFGLMRDDLKQSTSRRIRFNRVTENAYWD